MMTDKEVVDAIEEVVRDYKHVLNCSRASLFANAPRLLMQISATIKLDMLYMFLKQDRPKFRCDGACGVESFLKHVYGGCDE